MLRSTKIRRYIKQATGGELDRKEAYNQLENVAMFIREGNEIVVVGQPKEDNESYNCDFMGCSSVEYVIYRARVTNERK